MLITFWENKKLPQFWPLLTPYLGNKNLPWIGILNTHVILWYLSSVGEWTKADLYFLRKSPNTPFLTPFPQYLGNKSLYGLQILHTHVILLYLPCVGEWTKSVCYFLRKSQNTPFLTPYDPISREQKFIWTWNFAQTCNTIISFFTEKMNQIVCAVFEKMPKTPIFDPFWPHISGTKILLDLKLGTHM